MFESVDEILIGGHLKESYQGIQCTFLVLYKLVTTFGFMHENLNCDNLNKCH